MTRMHPALRLVDALVLVDISPRWLYGHTREDACPDGVFHTWTAMLGHLTRRLHAVTRYLEEMFGETIPVATMELETLSWLRMPRRTMTLALAGLYGDACVQQASLLLQARGHSVVVVQDLCVWEEFPVVGYPVTVVAADDLWPDLGAWIAENFSDDPVSWDGQPLRTSNA